MAATTPTNPSSFYDQPFLPEISAPVFAGDQQKLVEVLAKLATTEWASQAIDFALLCQCSTTTRHSLEIARYLLEERKADPSIRHRKGRRGVITCLLAACGSPQTQKELIELLLKHKADPNVPDDNGNTPLLVTALRAGGLLDGPDGVGALLGHRGNVAFIPKLVDNGANLTHKNDQGNTAVHALVSRRLDASFNSKELITALVNQGAALFAQNNQGDTPLLKATRQDNGPDVSTLLALIAASTTPEKARLTNKSGLTPVHEAAIWASPDLLRSLVASGLFDLNAPDADGNTPIMAAGNRSLVGAVVRINDPLEPVRVLLEARVDLDRANKAGQTALHQTEISREYTQLLTAMGPNFLWLNNQGQTSLLRQAQAGKCYNFDAILEAREKKQVKLTEEEVIGLGKFRTEQSGDSIFHLLTALDQIDAISRLTTFGGVALRADTKNSRGDSIVDVALKKHALQTINWFVETKVVAKETLIDAEKLKKWTVGANGWTLLHSAAARGAADVVTILLDSGADVNVEAQFDEDDEPDFEDPFGDIGQPLHLASRNGYEAIVRELINRGADVVSTKSSVGNTPLHIAVTSNHNNVARAILESIDKNKAKELLAVTNTEGLTPLDEAKIREGHTQPDGSGQTIIQLLESYC